MKRYCKQALAVGLVLAFVSILMLTGCGQSEAEKAQEAYDQDVADLKAAVEELKKRETYSSVDSVKSAFQNVQTAYDDAVASGKSVTNAKITQAEDAFNQLKEDIDSISSDASLSEKLDALNTAVQRFADEVEKI